MVFLLILRKCCRIKEKKLCLVHLVKFRMIILIQRLFDTYVKSIVNYGCEVWGFHRGVDIETLHLSFLKRVLKVRKSTSNYMVYFELGRFLLYINRYCRMLKYWFKIFKTENCILKIVMKICF